VQTTSPQESGNLAWCQPKVQWVWGWKRR